MQLNVRNIAAHCPKCGADDFVSGAGKRFDVTSQTPMRCTACGTETAYIELIMQIADKAVALSAEMLEEVRRRRGG